VLWFSSGWSEAVNDTEVLVSVVVPNYNYSKYLRRRLDSILGQTVRSFELIVIDDCSTDDSVELIKKNYGQAVNQLIVNDKNSASPFPQWNKGASLAKGKYLWIAEADDDCEPTFLEEMLALAKKSQNLAFAYSRSIPIDSSDNVLDADFLFSYVADLDGDKWRNDYVIDGRSELMNVLSRKNAVVNVSSVVFDREKFLSIGGAPTDMKMCADWMTYCRLAMNGDVAYCAKGLNRHRQHVNRHTRNSVIDLTYFREFLAVQNWVLENSTATKGFVAELFSRFENEWNRLTVSDYGKLGVGKQIKLADLMLSTYASKGYTPQIIRTFFRNSIRSVFAA
jgi:glycosyltransferase involved in cell wall biosynthesis